MLASSCHQHETQGHQTTKPARTWYRPTGQPLDRPLRAFSPSLAGLAPQLPPTEDAQAQLPICSRGQHNAAALCAILSRKPLDLQPNLAVCASFRRSSSAPPAGVVTIRRRGEPRPSRAEGGFSEPTSRCLRTYRPRWYDQAPALNPLPPGPPRLVGQSPRTQGPYCQRQWSGCA
jgi:hypothetical protein